MPVGKKIQASELRAALTAIGSAISVPSADYPDTVDISKAVNEFLEAVVACQIAQNAFADTGEDVSMITKAQGATTTTVYDGTTYTVVPTVYNITQNLVTSVSNALPPLS